MRKILFALIIIPTITYGQKIRSQEKNNIDKPYHKNEIGLSTGAMYERWYESFGSYLWYNAKANYLRNYHNIQIGAQVENLQIDFDGGELFMAGIVNIKQPIASSYFYAGTAFGYYKSNSIYRDSYGKNAYGYAIDIHAGLAIPIGGRFSFVTEGAFRWTKLWHKVYYRANPLNLSEDSQPIISTFKKNYYSIPVTMGVRYSF